MKKVQIQEQLKGQTKKKRKTPEQRSSNQKYFTSFMGLKFTPTRKRNNIELQSNIQNYTSRLRLAEFFPKQRSKQL